MITITSSGSSIVFEFDDNQHYLQNGTIEVPVNSLMLVTDDSGMFTFKKSSTNDIFLSGLYTEIGMTKDELIAFYKENMVGEQGGGSSSGITSGEVQSMIDESISGKQDTLIAGENITISGNVISAEGGKPIEAGRGISVTTGETADTVSFNLPISAGTGTDSILFGIYNTASGGASHAEGNSTKAVGYNSHAEGERTSAMTDNCHAEGRLTKAVGYNSHAEGASTVAEGPNSHAEGYCTKVYGDNNHAEGYYTVASGGTGSYWQTASHAEGCGTSALTDASHAEGKYTYTSNESEHSQGRYNVSTSASTAWGDSGNTLFSVGNGTGNNARHNAFEIRQNGDIYLTKDGQDVKLQDQLGGGITSGEVQTMIDESISGITTDVNTISGKVNTNEEVTARALNTLNGELSGKADTSAVTAVNNVLTAHTADTSIHFTTGTVQTMIDESISGKVDTSSVVTAVTSASTNSEIPTALAVYAATSGGSEGGGKAVSGGTNISITTGETADTINCTLNISNGTGTKSIKIGDGVTASGIKSFAGGYDAIASGNWSFAFGRGYATNNYAFAANGISKATSDYSAAFNNSEANNIYAFSCGNSIASGYSSFASGWCNKSLNNYESSFGYYNLSTSASTAWGDSGNTLFSVGNGTADNARHNAFEIRQNGDIYCSDGTNDVKLQDTITATAANTTALGGLSLVKLTQSEYDSLATKDSQTLYIVTDS